MNNEILMFCNFSSPKERYICFWKPVLRENLTDDSSASLPCSSSTSCTCPNKWAFQFFWSMTLERSIAVCKSRVFSKNLENNSLPRFSCSPLIIGQFHMSYLIWYLIPVTPMDVYKVLLEVRKFIYSVGQKV